MPRAAMVFVSGARSRTRAVRVDAPGSSSWTTWRSWTACPESWQTRGTVNAAV
ncbi:hypothetical protein ACU4GG_40965 [Streptomyces nojiriensis]